jgi:hypothetical protein
MRPQGVITIFAILGLLFITVGDRVLPEPLSTASVKTRTNINQYLIGLFPDWKPKDPNQRTKEAIEQQEQQQQQKTKGAIQKGEQRTKDAIEQHE